MKDEDTLDSVEQRLMHGLLVGLHDPSQELRVRWALQGLPHARRSWMPRMAAATAFMAVGLFSGLLLQSRLPEASAVIERASAESRVVVDRQYAVTVTALKQPTDEKLASATLHVRGADAFAIRFDAVFGKGWYGSNGTTTWYESDKGDALQWPAPEAGRWKEKDKIAFVKFESFLRTYRDRYDVVTLGREGDLIRVRATRRLDLTGENISQFEIWVSEKTGVMTKLHYRMDPELWHWEPWVVSIELSGEEAHPEDFFLPQSPSRQMGTK